MKLMPRKKGFTLIELLIVIGILSVLAAVVVLVLNPAELLRQARDTTRISNLATLKSALTLYLSIVTSPDLGSCPGTGLSNARCTAGSGCGAASTSTLVNGTGWIDVNFTSMVGGSPLAALPLDPSNGDATCAGTTCRYVYACSETAPISFELNANMESVRYASGGQDDVESNDGGDTAGCYEVGTSLTLVTSC